MPPRYAYWTILIDGKATAFRARERDELLPTLNQLRRTNDDVALKYFARGKLWDTPEQAQWANRNLPETREPRDRDWRPGGTHKDPRARFKPKREKPAPAGTRAPRETRDGGDDRAGRMPPSDDRARRPFKRDDDRERHDVEGKADRGTGSGDRPRGQKPEWRRERPGPSSTGRPWREDRRDRREDSGAPRPWMKDKPSGSTGDRPWRKDKPSGASGDRPWRHDRPTGAGMDRPWRPKTPGGQGGPREGDRRPQGKPGWRGPDTRDRGFESDRRNERTERSAERPRWQGERQDRPPASSGKKPWRPKPPGGPREDRSPSGDQRFRSGDKGPARPPSDKPSFARGEKPAGSWRNKPWTPKPVERDRSGGDRERSDRSRPPSDRPGGRPPGRRDDRPKPPRRR